MSTTETTTPTTNLASTTTTIPQTTVRPVVFPGVLLAVFIANLVVGVVDPLLTKSTIDQVNNDAGTLLFLPVSWLIAAGLYMASVLAPIKIGLAEGKGEKPGGVLVFWIGLGAALFMMRLFEDVLVAGGDWSEFQWMNHFPMALVILFLYLLTGAGFRYVAREYIRSPWHLVHPVMKLADQQSTEASQKAGIALHALNAFDSNRVQASLWSAEYDAHLTRIRNAEDEIKDAVRIAIVAWLASPADASVAKESHKPTNTNEGAPTIPAPTPTPTNSTDER